MHSAVVRRPDFSVIITTRNRPETFAAALGSVLAQTHPGFEVVVVDDGSSDPCRAEYARLEAQAALDRPGAVRFVHLPQTSRGHGPCFALNTGAKHAGGRYLCFLDDDDTWTDAGHLADAMPTVIEHAPDLLLFDQAAFRSGTRLSSAIWLEDLGSRLTAGFAGARPPAFTVSVKQLLSATGFCHVNSTIVSAALFAQLGGFDEKLPYEGDRDFYLRAIDRANLIKYCPRTVAAHTVPDPAQTTNMSTRVSLLDKHRCQFRLLDRAMREAAHRAIRDYARRHRWYALQKALSASRSAADVARIGYGLLPTQTRRRRHAEPAGPVAF